MEVGLMIFNRESLDCIKTSLQMNDILLIFEKLGVNRFLTKDNTIIFPTVCHNEKDDNASLKLYYYADSYLFKCYTECSDSFDIFEMVRRFFSVRGTELSFGECVSFIVDISNKNGFVYYEQENKNDVDIDIYKKKDVKKVIMPEYNKNILNLFLDYYYEGWLEEGISIKTMKQFDIKLSIFLEKIIIPHYDEDGELVGIRGRTLNKEEEISYGKYMPIKIEKKYYNHPLSYNLYGLNLTKEAIAKTKTAILFEGEKSVLKFNDAASYNNSAAVCGSALSLIQVEKILKLGAKEIVLAFDKEYVTYGTEDYHKNLNKLFNIAKKYDKYINFSIIIDLDDLLDYKDSPIDKGWEIFKRLYKKRMIL